MLLNNIFLTQNSTPIIGFCARILGYVMSYIYQFFSKGMNIENIGLCIIVFTLIVKLLMIPLTVKQQKFSKLSTLMNPELQEIQKKYRNKRDTESMMKMNEETQAVYQKYGTSPTGSCLQLLIQMPILFSLYYIISSIPAYVPDVYNHYKDVSQAIVADYDYYKYMNKAYDKYVKEDDQTDQYKYVDEMLDSFNKISEKKVVDVLAKYSTKQWDDLIKSYENIDGMANDLSSVKESEWNELIDEISSETKQDKIKKLSKAIQAGDLSKIYDDTEKTQTLNSDFSENVKNNKTKIMNINQFGPINLSQSPKSVMGIALIIPILSFLMQWLSVQISMSSNKDQMKDNPMASSMKVMNIMMPLMSAFIAFTVPAGLGLYWTFTAFFQVITQICINAYFKKIDVQDIINSNVEKMNKKKERMGIDTNKVSDAASTNTKNINSKANMNKKSEKSSNSKNNNNSKDNKSESVKYKAGSMASKANMVKEYNEKNRK